MAAIEADEQWASLAAAVDEMVPADEWPAGWAGGVAALVEHDPDVIAPLLEAVRPLLAALDAEAR